MVGPPTLEQVDRLRALDRLDDDRRVLVAVEPCRGPAVVGLADDEEARQLEMAGGATAHPARRHGGEHRVPAEVGHSIRLWAPATMAPDGSATAAPMGMPPAS